MRVYYFLLNSIRRSRYLIENLNMRKIIEKVIFFLGENVLPSVLMLVLGVHYRLTSGSL